MDENFAGDGNGGFHQVAGMGLEVFVADGDVDVDSWAAVFEAGDVAVHSSDFVVARVVFDFVLVGVNVEIAEVEIGGGADPAEGGSFEVLVLAKLFKRGEDFIAFFEAEEVGIIGFLEFHIGDVSGYGVNARLGVVRPTTSRKKRSRS